MKYRIDHIGYLTDDIDSTSRAMSLLGYISTPIIKDDTQRCWICFLEKVGEVRIELVKPYDDNLTMQRMLKKQGGGPYHTCQIVDSIESVYQELISQDFLPLFKPIPAVAFDGRRICYFFKREIGYLEIVEANNCSTF